MAKNKQTSEVNDLKRRILILVVAALLFLGALVPFMRNGGFGGKKNKEEPVNYAYVLVHGLGGWGAEEGINQTAPYWGSTTGSIAKYLTDQGYTVHEASVGPFSSTWDRACELYAQIKGGKVDYGEAHAAAHGHARFGRTYETPMVPDWGTATPGGQNIKVNLIGHSFGGNTVRLLDALLAYGDAAEQAKSGADVSPLFAGGNDQWVHSVTTLATPHNGSSLFLLLQDFKVVDTVLDLCLGWAGVAGNSALNGYLDFHLEQFGITQVPGEATTKKEMKEVISKVFSTGTDNAAYDLSPEGASFLNARMQLNPNVYYFSYAYSTTQPGSSGKGEAPVKNTLPVLMPTALLMGNYTNEKAGVDKTWQANDGLVNVVSAQYPAQSPHRAFDENAISLGVWNVMPLLDGDHGTAVGLNQKAEDVHTFYDTLFTRLKGLPHTS